MDRRQMLATPFIAMAGAFLETTQNEPPLDARLKALQELLDIQCSQGNWNYDPYMHGMANGMILAQSLVTGKEPDYLDPPEHWLSKDETESYGAGQNPTQNLLSL